MKAIIIKRSNIKRLLSVILVFAMVLTILPMNSMTAYANSATYDESTKTIKFIGTGELDSATVDQAMRRYPSATGVEIYYSSIGKSAFARRTGITSVKILSSVTSIGDSAFKNCTELTSITFESTTVPTISGRPFDSIKSTGVIKVPSGTYSAYRNALQNSGVTLSNTNWVIQQYSASTSHTHSFSSAWSYSAAYHWHACTASGNSSSCLTLAAAAKAVHSGGTATCQTRAVCNTCRQSYGSYAAHNWGSWDASTGTRLCQTNGCTATDTCGHDGITSGKCPTCGKTIYPNTATVTFNENGGTWDNNYTVPDKYTEGTGLTLPTSSNISKKGYTFVGWFDNEECTGNPVTSISTSDKGNKIYYAKWTHVHGDWSYSVENTSTLKATCGNAGCTNPTKSVSLTINANLSTYNDDVIAWCKASDVSFTITGASEWNDVFGENTVPTIQYEGTLKTGIVYSKSSSMPTQEGTYKASISSGGATAYIDFVIGHDYADQPYVNMGNGKHAIKCKICDTYETEENHDFSEYVYNNDASCATAGTKTATCSLCGATDTIEDSEHPATNTHIDENYDGICDICTYRFAYIVAPTSRLLGTSDTVSTIYMSPSNGLVKLDETVSVTAQNLLGYNFKGWYLSTDIDSDNQLNAEATVLSTNYTYTFIPEYDIAVVAVYESVGNASIGLTGSGYTVKINNGTPTTEQNSTYTAQVPLGSSITVTVSDSDFVSWTNSNGKIVSTANEFTFTMTGDINYTMTKKGKTGSTAMVEFASVYGQVIAGQIYSSTDTISFPVGPTKMGYIFTGWNLTEEKIHSKIENGETHIRVSPIYKQDTSNTFTVTVYVNDEQDDTQTAYNILSGATKTVNAPFVEGKEFLYWTDGEGNVLGYNTSYFMQVNKDITVKAVYGDEVVVAKPVIAMTNVFTTSASGKNKISFSVTRDIPTGYTLIEHGMLYNKTGTVANPTDSTFVVGGSGVSKYVATDSAMSGVFTLNVNMTAARDTKVVARGYMVVKNSRGETEIYYSDIVNKSYNEAVSN